MTQRFITYTLHETLYDDNIKEDHIVENVMGMGEIRNMHKILIINCES
jgi:hypothetical protein